MPAGSLVALADVKKYLNISRTTNDSELQDMLTDAVAAVADVVGPLVATQYTDTYDRHGAVILLDHTPVVSVQSVLVAPWLGAAQIDDSAAWLVNPQTGVLRRQLFGGALPWLGPGSIFTVTYTAGASTVPAPVNRAILMQVREMWKSQRGSMPLPATGEAEGPELFPGFDGFLAPGVMDLLLPYLKPPGVA